MSQENVDLVRAAMEAWNRGDWDAVLDLVDAAIEWRLSGALPDLEDVYHGHEGVKVFWREWSGSWESIRAEPERFVDLGDRVLVVAHFHAVSRDGLEIDQQVAFLFTLREGLLLRFRSYLDRAEAFEAAGLRE